MKTLHILIVEDDLLVAMGLEMMVTEIVTATVVVKESVAAAKKILHDLLDFAFVSGSPQEQLPSDLRSVPFIPKPCYPAQIERVLHAIVD